MLLKQPVCPSVIQKGFSHFSVSHNAIEGGMSEQSKWECNVIVSVYTYKADQFIQNLDWSEASRIGLSPFPFPRKSLKCPSSQAIGSQQLIE
jgi:hypothetical protein